MRQYILTTSQYDGGSHRLVHEVTRPSHSHFWNAVEEDVEEDGADGPACGCHFAVLTRSTRVRVYERPCPPTMSASGSESDQTAPRKRARGEDGGGVLPPLSVSILGVDPVDELVREVADFVHAMIGMRAHDLGDARIEVEAKVGVVRERGKGTRLTLPVTCETGGHALILREAR
jgi:hypothetical protein